MTDLYDTIRAKKLPSDFSTKYDTYIQSPLVWLLPLDTENKITKLSSKSLSSLAIISNIKNIFNLSIDKGTDNKYHINFTINKPDAFDNSKNSNVRDYYENLLFGEVSNTKMTIEYLFEKYGIYYDPFEKDVKTSSNLNILTDYLKILIQMIMKVILVNSDTITITSNTAIENYYKNVYGVMINEFVEDNKTCDTINKLIKSSINTLPKFTKETAKVYTKAFFEKTKINFTKQPKILAPFILDAINENSFSKINEHFTISNFNLSSTMQTVNKLNKVANKLPGIRCNKINNLNKDELNDMVSTNNEIEKNDIITKYGFNKKIYELTQEDIDKLSEEDKDKYIETICLVGSIEYTMTPYE